MKKIGEVIVNKVQSNFMYNVNKIFMFIPEIISPTICKVFLQQ